MEDRNTRIARELVRLAKSLVAVGETGVAGPAAGQEDLDATAARLKAKLDSLYAEYELALSARNAEYERAKSEYKIACDKMKVAVEQFNEETGWGDQLDACAAEVEAFIAAGGEIKALGDKFEISSGLSKQPSYKEWLMWVISVITSSGDEELKKFEELYLNHLNTFRKNTTRLKTSCDMLGSEKKSWPERMRDLYDEQGMRLPRASVSRRAGGGLFGWLGDLFTKIKDAVIGFISSATENTIGLNEVAEKARSLSGNPAGPVGRRTWRRNAR